MLRMDGIRRAYHPAPKLVAAQSCLRGECHRVLAVDIQALGDLGQQSGDFRSCHFVRFGTHDHITAVAAAQPLGHGVIERLRQVAQIDDLHNAAQHWPRIEVLLDDVLPLGTAPFTDCRKAVSRHIDKEEGLCDLLIGSDSVIIQGLGVPRGIGCSSQPRFAYKSIDHRGFAHVGSPG